MTCVLSTAILYAAPRSHRLGWLYSKSWLNVGIFFWQGVCWQPHRKFLSYMVLAWLLLGLPSRCWMLRWDVSPFRLVLWVLFLVQQTIDAWVLSILHIVGNIICLESQAVWHSRIFVFWGGKITASNTQPLNEFSATKKSVSKKPAQKINVSDGSQNCL